MMTPDDLPDVQLPDSPVCVNALDVARTYSSPALLNHSIRAYVWAAALGTSKGIAFDSELLFAAAMLHDLGLFEDFDNHSKSFEEASGSVAWVFAAGAGWPTERRVRLSEVIVRHMWPEVDAAEDPDGYLLWRATGLDIVGIGIDDFPVELRRRVLEQYPRLTLADEFLRCFQDQASRKPHSSPALRIATGLADRLTANPLEKTERSSR